NSREDRPCTRERTAAARRIRLRLEVVMRTSKRLSQRIQRNVLPTVVVIAPLTMILRLLVWSLARRPQLERHAHADASPAAAATPGLDRRIAARFTLIEYPDLERPYCQAYFPILMRWIDANPDVNWQWHHLPLAMHDPVATHQARLVECAGETGGHAAFWDAV